MPNEIKWKEMKQKIERDTRQSFENALCISLSVTIQQLEHRSLNDESIGKVEQCLLKQCVLCVLFKCDYSTGTNRLRKHTHTHTGTHLFVEFSVQQFNFRLLCFNFTSIFVHRFQRLAQFIIGLILFLLIKIDVAIAIFRCRIWANVSHRSNQIDHFIDWIQFCSA